MTKELSISEQSEQVIADDERAELSVEEREAMRSAREAMYPSPHNPDHADQVDVALWDAFELGYRAALNEQAKRASSRTAHEEPFPSGCTPCADCGIDYAAYCGAWLVADAIWQRVVGTDPTVVLCPSCFAVRAAREVEELPGDGQWPGGHDSHWATVVIDDAFEPRELTEAESVELDESGLGIAVERMWIRPGVQDTEGDGQRLTEELAERMAVIEELPGDGQRVPVELQRRFLNDAEFHAQVEMARAQALAEGARVTTEAVLLTLNALDRVRDTEREHEPTDESIRLALADELRWRQEYIDEIGQLHRHVEVLAKALDKFLYRRGMLGDLEKAS